MSPTYLPHDCPDMRSSVEDPRVPVLYEPTLREYLIALSDSSAGQLIHVCPWCGVRLPESLRDRYFDELDDLGIDYPDQQPPAKYSTDAWWRAT